MYRSFADVGHRSIAVIIDPSVAASGSRRDSLPSRRYPRHVVQSDHRKPLKLPLPSDLAAGGPPRRNRPVKPLPSPLTTARDHGLEDSKAQGAIYKAKTHRNSARRTPLCYFYCRFWNSITIKKIIKMQTKICRIPHSKIYNFSYRLTFSFWIVML
jgi:hypothetical protein